MQIPSGGSGSGEMLRSQLSLALPSPFDFETAATSHGWVELAPNAWDRAHQAMQRVHRLDSGTVVLLDSAGAGSSAQPEIAIQVGHVGQLSPQEQGEIVASVGRMFRADEDLSAFYALCRARGGRWLKLTTGLGRLLRSPSVFEDVVKTICTTNIQWGGTKGMIRRLVGAFGAPYPGDPALRAFPSAEAFAPVPAESFAQTVRMGYRASYVQALAQRVASGELDLEALRDAAIPTPELRKRLLKIKGVGNYAAATLLMLLGRYDELALDTAFRELVTRKYFGGQPPSDAQARAVYEEWGAWKYLAFWFDIREDYEERAKKP